MTAGFANDGGRSKGREWREAADPHLLESQNSEGHANSDKAPLLHIMLIMFSRFNSIVYKSCSIWVMIPSKLACFQGLRLGVRVNKAFLLLTKCLQILLLPQLSAYQQLDRSNGFATQCLVLNTSKYHQVPSVWSLSERNNHVTVVNVRSLAPYERYRAYLIYVLQAPGRF